MRIANLPSPARARALRIARLALAAASLLALVLAAPARAAAGSTIISRCTHGESLSGFSQQAYSEALKELPTEVEEYSDCGSLIRSAQLAGAGRGTGPGSAGAGPIAATPLTPAERSVLKRVPKTGSAPVRVGGQIIHPGVVHANVAAVLSKLPTPLLTILAFLLACALLLAARAIRSRVLARDPR